MVSLTGAVRRGSLHRIPDLQSSSRWLVGQDRHLGQVKKLQSEGFCMKGSGELLPLSHL